MSRPVLCGAQVGEFCDENGCGGVSIRQFSFSSLAFVDDIVSVNNHLTGVHESHEEVTFFSDKKR